MANTAQVDSGRSDGTNPLSSLAPHNMTEPQIANFAYGRPGAARNLVDPVSEISRR